MSLTLDTPLLTPAAADLEPAFEEHLALLVETARSASGGSLQAVVLGGSLARGSGVVLRNRDGESILSDIDLYLVLRHPRRTRGQELREAIQRAHLKGRFRSAKLDLGVVGSGWFSSLPPTLPAHQLAHGHRVLWSRSPAYRVQIPGVDPERGDGVDRDDALQLLMNRFAEQLLLADRLHGNAPDALALYHRWKLYLDAPLAWLSLRGRYHPDRERQREALTEVWERLGSPRPSWWRMGIELHRRVHEHMRDEILDPQLLASERPESEWSGLDVHLEGLGEVRRARIPELNWTWPFFRDGLRVCLGIAHRDPGSGLQRAVEEGAPGSQDLVLARKWLRRHSLPSRLREARRWALFAPRPITPWFRHGFGGSGPERTQMACALRFGGLDNWPIALEGLLPGTELTDRAPSRGEELDLWLGHQWSGWVMERRQP